MFNAVIKRIFGSRNERVLRRMDKRIEQINAFEPAMQALTDEALCAKTEKLRQRHQQGETLEQLLPEAFAVVREAGVRTLGLRHFDVQLIGGIVLHDGKIAEMRTGEGKTLTATLAVYLNALSGHGIHIVTVNDYLAKRDSEWMAPIYEFLGLSVGVILTNMLNADKQAAYQSDVIFGTNNEFGFDYLRDNMAFSLADKVQRKLFFAIVDEVDSILIDEARTPLIISGATEDSSELYIKINKLIPQLTKQLEEEGPGDFSVDEKQRQAFLTEDGHQRVEELMVQAGVIGEHESLYDPVHIMLMHHINAALRAHALFNRDVDYIVQNNEVVIVDEHTGRTMPGRRWSEGLHQAVEAKEGVSIQSENQTLASITFQNYFRLYDKLAGMTGTADTEAYEFQQIYALEVVVIPTNKSMIRKDMIDLVYLHSQDKYQAIIVDIKECCERRQPVLVGTASIETSELLSKLLKKEKLSHQVLNAKFHEKEASIIAEAGQPGAVTIATNMAGRGTDIVLGGSLEVELQALGDKASDAQRQQAKEDWQQRHQQVLDAGGLHIIGSERHESRRIDNQLRGRSGRQGDPGSSRFYLSLEDNLMRIFASDRMRGIMQKVGMKPGEAIEHPWITKAIENAQRKVEGRNFEIRKQLLDFDDVANAQRQVIYQQRSEIMSEDNLSATVASIREDVVEGLINMYVPPGSLEEQWEVSSLQQQLARDFSVQSDLVAWLDTDHEVDEAALRKRIETEVEKAYLAKATLVEDEAFQRLEKSVLLRTLDDQWRQHLAAMDYLRQGIHLRGYAQKDPKQEYKRESFTLFSNMLDNLKHEVISVLCNVQIRTDSDVDQLEDQRLAKTARDMKLTHEEMNMVASQQAQTTDGKPEPFVRDERKIGRNEPCPCGSGKKYKQCHGKLQ
ncbi:MAG: preprotein translocase subunit SecA [Gammaproteobacteria bacterium]